MGAIFLRELQSYFQAMTGFIFTGLFLLFTGIIFALRNLMPPGSSDFRSTFDILNIVLLVAVPVLTMRLLSEESRQKTDQLLLTSPVSLSGIVLGKFLAALTLFTVTLAVTGLFPAFIGTAGLVVPSELVCAYLGELLLGASLVAVGLFVSSLTDNQVGAFFFTFGALLFIYIIQWVQQALPSDRYSGVVFACILSVTAGAFVFSATRSVWAAIGVAAAGIAATFIVYGTAAAAFDGLIVRTLRWFSLLARYGYFRRGVLAAGPILYFASFAGTFLFLTVRVIERRRWA